MIKNIIHNILLIIILFCICSCKKKNNIYLAKNYYEQSLVEAEQNNIPQALHLIDESIKKTSTAQALALKATLLYQNNKFQEALEIYIELLKKKDTPTNLKADILNNLACTYLALGQKENAKKMWLNLTTNSSYMSPEVAWFNLGLLELSNAIDLTFNNEKFKDIIKMAQRYFSKAISISNEYTDAYYYLALTYIHLKEFNKAKEIIISLLSISPDHEPAQELLNLANKG